MVDLKKEISSTTYPGRGIIIGKSADGKKAVIGYFIMGRSANSRNRVFVKEGNDLKTQAFDPSKLVDPSLIIYAPVRTLENATIVTNGDQTDTARDFILEGKTFEEALRTRTFEPDPPNFTPRISGILEFADGDFSYKMSILKSNCGREVRDISFTLINVTAIPFRHLRVNRHLLISMAILMSLQIMYGTLSMRITKYHFIQDLSTLQQVNLKIELSIKISNRRK